MVSKGAMKNRQRRRCCYHLLPVSVLALGLLSQSAIAGTYSSNFNTDPTLDPTPLEIRDNAKWVASGSYDGSGYISLTDAVNSQQGSIVLPDFDNGASISGFTLTAKVRLGGGTARPADGMSFSFADASDGAVAGGSVGEEGTATGLSINLDTWDNGNGDGPAIDLKLNGATLAHKRFAGTGPGTSSPGPYCAPVEKDPSGNPISLETDPAGTPNPGVFVTLTFSVSESGSFSLTYKGLELFKELAIPGWAPRAGRWIIGARTGNANDNNWIDDLNITTITPDQIRPYVSGITPTRNLLRDLLDNQEIGFVISAPGFDVVDTSIKLAINGTDVSSSIVVGPGGGGPFDKSVTYTPPAPWPLNSRQEAVLTWSDNGTPAGSGVSRLVFWVGPIPIVGTLFIEAEDFNYTDGTTGGLFFDFGSPNGSYNTLAAKHDTDYHEAGSNTDSPLYRVLTPPNGISVPGTPDNLRAGVPLDNDYKVGWNDAGDWYNFTRMFSNTTYKIYGRFASGGLDTHSQLDRVTSDPSQPNQTTVPLGRFDGDATGGWDTFCFIPLRNASGEDVILRLKDLTTLRVTVLSAGNYDFNYLAFVPTLSPTLRPNVISTDPADKSLSVRNPKIKVVIGDADTKVVASSIKIFLDNNELTPLVITDTADGAIAEFQLSNLPEGSSHTAKVTFADDDATPFQGSATWTFTVGPFKGQGGTLFIEAEDFNYANDDSSNPGQFADFGAPSCSLANKNAVPDVDYHEGNNGNDPGAVPAYRPAAGVEAAKQGTDGFTRADQTIPCNYIVGWNDAGDWYNYTRTFPGNKRYNVFARLASGGADEHADLSLVTSDPSQPGQTTQSIGQFNATATGNWDVFHTVQLKDVVGQPVSIRLSGVTTLRFTVLPGNLDVNYLAFVESDVQFIIPSITVEPRPNSDYARQPRITAVIKDEDSKVVASTIKLTFDGADVTSASTITDTDSGAMVEYQVPFPSPIGTVHTAKVEFKDDQATPATGSLEWSYKEGFYNAERNLFIESEDFNTLGGEYLPSNTDPFNAKSLYNGQPATHNIDYHLVPNADGTVGNPDSPLYRVLDPPNGIVDLNDAWRTGAGPRPGFDTLPDYKVGWTDPGDWFNYTRNYGAGGFYNIYLRSSHGDPAATIGGGVDFVQGASTDQQTTTRLGRFRAPATGNWDGFIFIPLKDDASGAVLAPFLSGVQTLRYTVEANGGDINYMMLVPVCKSSINLGAGPSVTIHYSGGILQSAAAITGPWAPVAGAANGVFTGPLTGAQQYFRILCQ